MPILIIAAGVLIATALGLLLLPSTKTGKMETQPIKEPTGNSLNKPTIGPLKIPQPEVKYEGYFHSQGTRSPVMGFFIFALVIGILFFYFKPKNESLPEFARSYVGQSAAFFQKIKNVPDFSEAEMRTYCGEAMAQGVLSKEKNLAEYVAKKYGFKDGDEVVMACAKAMKKYTGQKGDDKGLDIAKILKKDEETELFKK